MLEMPWTGSDRPARKPASLVSPLTVIIHNPRFGRLLIHIGCGRGGEGGPGLITLIWMRCSLSSTMQLRTKLRMEALLAQYTLNTGAPVAVPDERFSSVGDGGTDQMPFFRRSKCEATMKMLSSDTTIWLAASVMVPRRVNTTA
jgi:hypothetical protein